jgi:nucleotide-binding universal stress UspA family protein
VDRKPVIVAAFSRTEEGEAALKVAVEEARRHQGRILVVHSSRGGPREDEAEAMQAHDRLEALDSELTGAGIDHEILYRVQGHAAENDILAVARESAAQLIVMGLRRRTPIGKALFGSTTQQVLLHAPCPVLAVPADAAATNEDWG